MTEPTTEPTAALKEPVTEPTVTEPAKKSFTQEELDKLFSDRQKRGEDAAAKRLEKQYKSQMDELTSKIKTFEEKDLTDVEKLKKDFEKTTGKLSDLTTQLTSTQIENAKLKALIKAGVQPDQLDGLLKRVSGSTEEEIFADVEELKGLGWIGQKTAPTPQSQALGTQTKTGESIQKPSLKDQIKDANARLLDPKLSSRERADLAKTVISLNNRLMKGET